MTTLLQDSQVKYRVLVDGKILNESMTKTLADVFVSGLDEDAKAKATIIPIVQDGRQLLFD